MKGVGSMKSKVEQSLDILLIKVPSAVQEFYNPRGCEIPLSLCYLGAYLKSHGRTTAVLDLDHLGRISPYLESALRQHAPRVVGITSYTHNIHRAERIAQIAKAVLPGVPVVVGGFHVSALPVETLQEFHAFDYAVFGEGEQTLLELVNALPDGDVDKVLGVAYRDGENIHCNAPRPLIENIDILPFPDRDLIPVHKYIPNIGKYFRLPTTTILSSRGCPHHCIFCDKSVFRYRHRRRSPENFLEELRYCRAMYGIRDFGLRDESPTGHRTRFRELCRKIIDERLDITWHCYARIDELDKEILHIMREAGCYQIDFGMDAVSKNSMDRIGKHLDLQQAREIVLYMHKIGMEVKMNYIIGFPWETIADIRETTRFARRIGADFATFNCFKPFPGSALYAELRDTGRLHQTPWDEYYTTSCKLQFDAKFTEEEVAKELHRAFFQFYFRPGYLVSRIQRYYCKPRRGLSLITRGLSIMLREAWGLMTRTGMRLSTSAAS